MWVLGDFEFWLLYGPSELLRWLFSVIFGPFCLKFVLSATLKAHKVTKIWNHPKSIHSFVKHIIGNKYTDFQPNLSIFEGPDTISVEKKVSKSRRGKRAKWPFFGQKSANFENFPKIFWNLIKLLEIHVWSKFQLIWTLFSHFLDILRPILGHFSLYIKNRKITIFYRTSTHVCLNKSRTVNFSI